MKSIFAKVNYNVCTHKNYKGEGSIGAFASNKTFKTRNIKNIIILCSGSQPGGWQQRGWYVKSLRNFDP